MSAVLDKPRAKIAPKATKSALQTRLDAIFSNLKLGQEKLQLAHQSVEMTDPGEAAEILLRTVIEDMLPAALAPMHCEPLARADVDAAYTGMFPALAAIEGVIALSTGQVIETTLREAFAHLDAANAWMDFTDMGDVLPHREDTTEADRGDKDLAVRSPAAAETENVAGRIFDAYERTLEARAILDARVSEMNTGAAYGARSLVDVAVDVTSEADATNTRDNCEYASCALHEAIEVLTLVTNETPDLAAQGARALLLLAKGLFDSSLEALP
ncbi:hypothetical protein [Variovorax sp. OV084]|uniref:hypothetical protein n=1 Tax=Variovorax sp. OV084 TaxID=1882777 RepID=UPI0008B232F1|nr:hypothetical protein [Variovorax sp. OV084]SES75073.1 hypothetical protein SAMN05443580_101160 [Variovorax sp. OV084]